MKYFNTGLTFLEAQNLMGWSAGIIGLLIFVPTPMTAQHNTVVGLDMKITVHPTRFGFSLRAHKLYLQAIQKVTEKLKEYETDFKSTR